MRRRALGRSFDRLWAAYAVSAYGSALGFGALPLLAVLVVRAGAGQVAALAAVGPAVGALLALPLGPWVEFRRKRRVMVAADLVRCAALAGVAAAYACGVLGFAQLLAVSAVLAAARIASGAASGALLRSVVRPEDLLVANSRLESTNWSSLAVGPPLGGAAVGLFGPVTTVVADAVSYLLSALGVGSVGHRERVPVRPSAGGGRRRAGGLWDGWRHLFGDPVLRALYLNNLAVSGLVMATEPLLAVLLLGRLGFPAWQYGLAFAVPCLGGLLGSRLARRVVARRGRWWVFRVVGTLRALWPVGLAFVRPGPVGLLTVIAVEAAIVVHMSLYTPVLATHRLEHTPPHLVARTLTAWSVGQQAAIALCTALAGLLADAAGPRAALLATGLLALATPLLLPREPRRAAGESAAAAGGEDGSAAAAVGGRGIGQSGGQGIG
ncbi:MFS transporter [Kitasatospora sp. NPDC088391]|uniref:MFS transporter n=1 Tax=Kitasatospora sp. NPDC088391 TaxID=3364074 RepID=UPI0038240F1F